MPSPSAAMATWSRCTCVSKHRAVYTGSNPPPRTKRTKPKICESKQARSAQLTKGAKGGGVFAVSARDAIGANTWRALAAAYPPAGKMLPVGADRAVPVCRVIGTGMNLSVHAVSRAPKMITCISFSLIEMNMPSRNSLGKSFPPLICLHTNETGGNFRCELLAPSVASISATDTHSNIVTATQKNSYSVQTVRAFPPNIAWRLDPSWRKLARQLAV